MTTYHVRRWDTYEIVYTFSNLPTAQRYARGMSHTGEDIPQATCYPPIAYVANEAGECVYNPRFGKSISAAVGGLINAQPPNHF